MPAEVNVKNKKKEKSKDNSEKNISSSNSEINSLNTNPTTSSNSEDVVPNVNPESNIDSELNNETNSSLEKKQMSTIEERLFHLRMKINQGRKANKEEVNDEYQRLNNKSKNNKSKKDIDNINGTNDDEVTKNKWNSDDAIMHQTAEQAEYLSDKLLKKEQNKATFGWQAFTVEAKHRAYEKQLKKLPTFKNNNTSTTTNNNNNSISHLEQNPLDYGKEGTSVSHAALERLSQHMIDKEIERKNHSKRRMNVDAHNVDYINDKNAAFNKKLKRSFDKYTVEIRQNLERGTAV